MRASSVAASTAYFGERVARPRPSYDTLLDEQSRELVIRRREGRLHNRGWVVRRALAAADLLGLLVAFLVAEYGVGSSVVHNASEEVAFIASLPCWLLVAHQYGLYSRDEERADHSTVDDVVGVFNMVTLGTWAFFVFTHLTGAASPSLAKLAIFWVSATALVVVGRALARAACRRTSSYLQATVILGAGHVGQLVARKLLQHPEYGVSVLGFVDAEPLERLPGLRNLTVLGTPNRLREIVEELCVDRVIVAFSKTPTLEVLDAVRDLSIHGVRVDIVPRYFEVLGPQVEIHTAEGLTLMGLPPAQWPRSALLLKRMLDVFLAVAGLLVLAPILLVVGLAIKLDSSGPVLFKQIRMGSNGSPFRIIKFRTMFRDADDRKNEFAHLNKHRHLERRMFKIPDDPRVTRIGRLLRAFSIDELPQLINVVRGEMSLVGPRPLILEEDEHVGGWERRRLALKPGITGLWQVLGRDDIPFDEMLGLDHRYVTTWSLSGDLKLILRTLPILCRARSVGETART